MSKRRRSTSSRRAVEAKFWGPESPDDQVDGNVAEGSGQDRSPDATMVRPTPDPGALIRSLGPPPLAVDPNVAERHLTAVYEEAVRTASALAAANGLLVTDSDDDERRD